MDKEPTRRVSKRKQDPRWRLINRFKSSGCAICKENSECCLEAHHRDPEKKDFSISKWFNRNVSEDRLKKELAKCICLCSNCHKKIHANELKLGS